MDIATILNGFISVIIIVPAILTIYMASKIKTPHAPLRILPMLLGLFLLAHGMYHLVEFSQIAFNVDALGFYSDSFVEPISWVFFVAFATYYLRRTG